MDMPAAPQEVQECSNWVARTRLGSARQEGSTPSGSVSTQRRALV